MFTITFRVTKKQLAAAAAALVLAFAGGLWAKSALSELAGDVVQAPAEVKIEKTEIGRASCRDRVSAVV